MKERNMNDPPQLPVHLCMPSPFGIPTHSFIPQPKIMCGFLIRKQKPSGAR
jgi:hypothetical protein